MVIYLFAKHYFWPSHVRQGLGSKVHNMDTWMMNFVSSSTSQLVNVDDQF
jgi:hypothetical protein